MKAKSIRYTIILQFYFCFLAWGNGWSGNGGDFGHEGNNIWNVGADPVQYCIFSSPGYPLTPVELEELVSESINDWKGFFQLYRLDKFVLGAIGSKLHFPDHLGRELSLDLRPGRCDGLSKDHDPGKKIFFLFEETSKPIREYKRLATENALGLALRKDYDHDSYRNGGYIWIGNFSTERNKIKHMLLHELGHIFGMGHDSVFVMDHAVADQIMLGDKFLAPYFGQIESSPWPYRIIPENEYVLTSNKGRPLGNPGLFKCRDDGYLPNDFLPKAMLAMFRLKKQDCHKISLVMERPTSQVDRIFSLSLSSQKQGLLKTFKGKFKGANLKRREHPSPGLFTSWVLNNSNKKVYGKLNLDTRSYELPAKGVFGNGNGKVWASRISMDRGLLVEIFLQGPGGKGQWWNLKTVYNGLLEK